MRGRLAALVFGPTVAGVISCGPSREPASPERAAVLRGWHYTVSVDEGVEHLDARVCFEGQPPPRFIPGRKSGWALLEGARAQRSAAPLPVDRRARALVLDSLVPGECLRYRVGLADAFAGPGWSPKARWIGDSLLVTPSTWLWRPPRLPEGADVTVRFDLPPSVDVSVNWPPVEGRPGSYRLDETAFRWLGHTVLGKFERMAFEVEGGQADVVIMDRPIRASEDGIRRWIGDAMQSVADLYGTFPVRHVQVVVVPIEGGGGPVYFGRAARGGGSSIYLVLDTEADDDELAGGWTTVHEFLHLGMPYVADAWMGEGFASYYTEIMRTRMGHGSEQDGWERLERAFGRGRRGGRGVSLQRASDWMGRLYAFHRVYWGGAAIAFMTDVELRFDSGGRLGLDDAVREIHRCCRHARDRIPATRVLKRLDAWYGKPLFSRIAEDVLERSSFPELESTYGRLGITIEDGEVEIDERSPGAPVRRAIMLGSGGP